jgi:hypothetical protein
MRRISIQVTVESMGSVDEKICSLPPKSIAVSSLPLKNTNFLGCHSFRFLFASLPFR